MFIVCDVICLLVMVRVLDPASAFRGWFFLSFSSLYCLAECLLFFFLFFYLALLFLDTFVWQFTTSYCIELITWKKKERKDRVFDFCPISKSMCVEVIWPVCKSNIRENIMTYNVWTGYLIRIFIAFWDTISEKALQALIPLCCFSSLWRK